MPDDIFTRDQRLCYHTGRLDHLLSTLELGFWPRYCPEDCSRLFEAYIGEQFWVAAPIVCFTDMLPDTNEAHRGRYGDYTIAITKDSSEVFDINPLIYVLPDSFVAEQLVNCLRPGRTGRLDKTSPVWPLLPYVKVTPGAQLLRGAGGRPDTWEILPMEDEMEWRYVANVPGLTLVEGVRESKDVPAALMALSEKNRLKIPHDNITDVIVPTKADADAVIARFPALNGRVIVRGKSLLKRFFGWLYAISP
ncbi:MAG TPA: abortive infection system antitoxin AbiGi family protein [Opitutaceae bacterium]|nr:abortive infection system antitoxin AbiGi family protein [Opitutaceae bacterium]